MKLLAAIGIGAVALGLVGVASGVPAKVTLTVAVSGSGNVTSVPAGINCKPKCIAHLRAGAKIILTANPSSGAEFSHWSAPCGQSDTCTVKMTKAKVVHAYFKTTPPSPPPPPPPPSPKNGHYVGTYTDGTFFTFDLQSSSITEVNFDFNGHCDNGGTSYDTGFYLDGPFSVGTDGSFSGKTTATFPDSVVNANVAGTVTTSGTASGTLNVSIAFSDGVNCTSTGTWTAQDQS